MTFEVAPPASGRVNSGSKKSSTGSPFVSSVPSVSPALFSTVISGSSSKSYQRVSWAWDTGSVSKATAQGAINLTPTNRGRGIEGFLGVFSSSTASDRSHPFISCHAPTCRTFQGLAHEKIPDSIEALLHKCSDRWLTTRSGASNI